MDIIEVKQASVIEAINRAEVDTQINTAKAYPRDIEQSLARIKALATLDDETAEDCFYAIRRGDTLIEGISIRFAEIVASQWGNLRVQARIIGNDGKYITAQGLAHDLETNFAASVEVKRRITDKNGKTYSEDMQVMAGNAAASIAFRNAVMKVVPMAVTHKIVAEIRAVAKGKALSLETRIKNMSDWFASVGVSQEQFCAYVSKPSVRNLTEDDVDLLRRLCVAIKEGDTTIKEVFGQSAQTITEATADAARKRAEAAKQRISKALSVQQKEEVADDKPIDE